MNDLADRVAKAREARGWSQAELARRVSVRRRARGKGAVRQQSVNQLEQGGVDAPRYGELDAIAWHLGNSAGRKQPVGTKAANALGFHDMIGNAWEWVNDWYGDYTRSAKTNPKGPESGTSRIARGSYFNYEEGFCRSSRRYEIQSAEFGGSTGFRVARNP